MAKGSVCKLARSIHGYAVHLTTCSVMKGSGRVIQKCNCGLDRLEKALGKVERLSRRGRSGKK